MSLREVEEVCAYNILLDNGLKSSLQPRLIEIVLLHAELLHIFISDSSHNYHMSFTNENPYYLSICAMLLLVPLVRNGKS